MQDDVYVLVQDGWDMARHLREVVKSREGKWSEEPDLVLGSGRKVQRLKAELIPPSVIVDRFLSIEQRNFEACEAAVDAARRALEELDQEHGDEDGLLAEVKTDNGKLPLQSVKARLKKLKTDPDFSEERAVLNEMCAGDRALDKAAATRKHGPVDDGPVAKRHNEAWEMDHTTLDVIVIDEETGLPIGRPTITVAIDRHSRAIPAYHVSWDAPGIHGVVECLRKGIGLKDALLEQVPDLRNPWPVFGVPDEIITDNAREFKSKALKEICSRLKIEHSRSPVLKAWYRGRIERAIKTLVYSTCHTVPGTTYANIFQRSKERVPEKVAVCTLRQLDEIITRFIVDVYHVRRHRTLNNSPIAVFQESVARNGMKPLPDPKKLVTILSLLYFRKPQPKGIVFEGLWYSSPRLNEYGTLPGASKIVSVKVDPNDISRIWYFDTLINDHVECRIQKSMRERIQGVTLETHKMARAIQRSNPELLARESGLSKSYALIRRALEDRVRGRDGLTNKRRAMRALAKLRKKAEAMFEDAPAQDPTEDDIGDMFGPEEALPDDDIESTEQVATEPEEERPQAEPPNDAAPKAPAKQRSPRTKTAKQPEPKPVLPPVVTPEGEDDMDDLERLDTDDSWVALIPDDGAAFVLARVEALDWSGHGKPALHVRIRFDARGMPMDVRDGAEVLPLREGS